MSPSTTNLGITNIGQISIIVKDVERATAFYRDVLGLPLLFNVPGMAFFDCGGVRLMLGTPSSPEYDHPSSILYFRVPDINAGHRQAGGAWRGHRGAAAAHRADADARFVDDRLSRRRRKHSPADERSTPASVTGIAGRATP